MHQSLIPNKFPRDVSGLTFMVHLRQDTRFNCWQREHWIIIDVSLDSVIDTVTVSECISSMELAHSNFVKLILVQKKFVKIRWLEFCGETIGKTKIQEEAKM